MMTWVSLRSGMASRGTRRSDHAPKTAAAPTISRTRALFRTEKSMTRAIMGSRGVGRRVPRRVAVEALLADLGAEGVDPPPVLRPHPRRGGALLFHFHAAHRVLRGGGGGP